MFKILLATSLIFFIGCGRDNITSGSQSDSGADFKNTFVYDKNSPYADVLRKCVSVEDETGSCKLSELPLLGQVSYTVTKEMILQRLVVSHQWMGDRFSQMLDRYSDKMIHQLFRATTAIVIDDDIIPSYYWAVTGAIYLDPRYFWMSANEKETITDKEDYRANFGSELQFLEAVFFRKDGNSLYTQDKPSRTLSDLDLPLAGLLYHELAHANDFVPPSMLTSLNNDATILQNITNIGANRTSEQLTATSPLTSSTLVSLGQVLYRGTSATSTQKQLTGVEVGNLFDDDTAAAMYAYSSRFEDTAMLFQSAMMKYFYNVDGFQIFFNTAAYEDNNRIDIEWGVKNPVLKQRVEQRAIFVSNRILPISGGWTEALASIADVSALLASNKDEHQKRVGGFAPINPNELEFLHPETRY